MSNEACRNARPAASSIARSITARIPSRSMSAIVNTWTPTRRSWLRSPRSTLRMPTSTVRGVVGHRHRPGHVLEPLVTGQAERHRQRHAVDVAAGRGRRRVDVGVRVQPDDAAGPAERPGQAAQRADRDRVVAAQHQRHLAVRHRPGDPVGKLLAGAADRRPVAGGGIALVERLHHARADVAVIVDDVAQLGHPLAQLGVADRGRPHVHAAPARPEVERRADHANRPRIVRSLRARIHAARWYAIVRRGGDRRRCSRDLRERR